eukprot:6389-Hanusia_phi.AAC.1
MRRNPRTRREKETGRPCESEPGNQTEAMREERGLKQQEPSTTTKVEISKRTMPETFPIDEKNKRTRHAKASRALVHSDCVQPGRFFDLATEAEALGLLEISSGRYVLRESAKRCFVARALPTRQILWESTDQVDEYDVKEIIVAMAKHEQAIHVNTGTHGDKEGSLITDKNDTMSFFIDDYNASKELEDSQVSIHCVTVQSSPFAPRKTNVIINAWCWSERYKFAEKMDPKTGMIPSEKHREHLLNHLPKNMRRVIQEAARDDDCDLDDAEKGYLQTDCTDRDPDLVTPSIRWRPDEVVENFLQDREKQVLLVQGKAGAGKSTLCKRWAMKLGKDWEEGKPYPVYLHLSSCMEVRQYLEDAFGSELSNEDFKHFIEGKAFVVLLDGYDELGGRQPRNVIRKVYEDLRGCQGFKAIITCRSDYLRVDGQSEKLFWLPRTGAGDALQAVWLCPINLSEKDRVRQYIEYFVSKDENTGGWSEKQYEETLMTMPELVDIVTTPLCLKIVLPVLPNLGGQRKQDLQHRITRHMIYEKYMEARMWREWLKWEGNEKLPEEIRAAGINDENWLDKYMDAGKALSLRMHRDNSTRIELGPGEDLWAEKDLEESLRGELLKRLVSGCPTRQKRLSHSGQERLEISFEHDTFRSFFLAEVTLDWLKRRDAGSKGVPQSLSIRSLSDDAETIREHAAIVRGNRMYSKRLLEVVQASKDHEDEAWGWSAANAASILVAAGVSLSGEDLRGARLRRAVLRNGIFHRTRLEGADLSEANLSHTYLVEAKLGGAKLTGAYFGERYYPRVDYQEMTCGCFSEDGKILVASQNCDLEVWDVATGECLEVFSGHEESIKSVSMSGDGRRVAS